MNNSIHFFYNFGVKNSKFKNYMYYHLTFNRNVYIYIYTHTYICTIEGYTKEY